MKMRTETIKMRFVDQLYTSKQKIHQIPQSKNKCNCLPDTYRKKQILQNKVFLVHTYTHLHLMNTNTTYSNIPIQRSENFFMLARMRLKKP